MQYLKRLSSGPRDGKRNTTTGKRSSFFDNLAAQYGEEKLVSPCGLDNIKERVSRVGNGGGGGGGALQTSSSGSALPAIDGQQRVSLTGSQSSPTLKDPKGRRAQIASGS